MPKRFENPSCDDMWICEKYEANELPLTCQIKIQSGECKPPQGMKQCPNCDGIVEPKKVEGDIIYVCPFCGEDIGPCG
jgi:hypothetical protein